MPSLNDLPDELILKIYHYLVFDKLDTDSINENITNYLNMAFTCKRFLYLAESRYNPILIGNQKVLKDPATVHPYAIFNIPEGYEGIPMPEPPESHGQCSIHGLAPNCECLYPWLYPYMGFKHLIYIDIMIVNYDLRKVTCIEAIDSSVFDRVLSLVLIRCDINSQVIINLLATLKNVKYLRLLGNRLRKNDKRLPLFKRRLNFLHLDDVKYPTWSDFHHHPLLEPNLQLSINTIRIWLDRHTKDKFWDIKERYKDSAERLRIFGSEYWICRNLEALRGTKLQIELVPNFNYNATESDDENTPSFSFN